MTMKVLENTTLNYKSKYKIKAQDYGASFADTLNNEVNKSNSSCAPNINIGKKQIYLNYQIYKDYVNGNIKAVTIDGFGLDKDAIELAEAFKHFDRIFSSSVTPDCFREDSTIDIKKILQNFGDRKISYTDLQGLNRDMRVFYKHGFLTDTDYEYFSNWISPKLLAFNVQIQKEEIVKDAFDSIERKMLENNNNLGVI